jgi:hypothetical protein
MLNITIIGALLSRHAHAATCDPQAPLNPSYF